MADEMKTPEVPEKVEENVADLKARIAALESDNEKLKQAQSTASSDAADWKRKYRETLDEATRKEQERTEREAEMAKLLEEYKAKDRVATYTSRLIACGVDPSTAESMAKSLPEGVSEDFFESQRAFLENKTKELNTKKLDQQPGLSVGTPPSSANAVDDEQMKLRKWAGL